MKIKYRQLGSGDAEQFQELRKEFIEKYPASFGLDNEFVKRVDFFRDWIGQSYIYGAFDGERLVGVAGFAQVKTAKEMHKGLVFSVGVTEKYQGKGIGRGVLGELLSGVVRDFPVVKRVSLRVDVENVPARKMYESFGFEEFGVERGALMVGDREVDQVLMGCKL